MTQNPTIEVRFHKMVDNAKAIIREGRHMDVAMSLRNELPQFSKFLDDVTIKSAGMQHIDREDYLMGKMLDAMDYIMDNWFVKYTPESTPNAFRVANSLYDVIHEFYFNDDSILIED